LGEALRAGERRLGEALRAGERRGERRGEHFFLTIQTSSWVCCIYYLPKLIN
jgi:hypothetical protein